LYDLAKWKFLFYTSHVPVPFRILFTLQSHAMSDLTKKYGHAKSGHTMKRLVFSYFAMSRI